MTDVFTELIDGLIEEKGLYCETTVANMRTLIRAMTITDANVTEPL